MKAYYVKYNMHSCGGVQGIQILANTKVEAYDKAVYEVIPALNDGSMPYSAWVSSVTYSNGNVHYFNTCEGLPY